jgi:predicted DNA-binding protein
LSVTLPAELRRRLTSEAKRRELKVATTARVLIDERIGELEDEAQLTRAEEWQRAQAWATWEKIKAGDTHEVSWKQLEAHTTKAIERVRRKGRAKTKAS